MIRLPKTLHIEGSGNPGNPDAIPFNKLKGQFLVIEEKLDGTGVAIFFDHKLNIQIWHRGHPAIGKEYNYLHQWIDNREEDLLFLLGERYILFGESCYHKHTIYYDTLPHFFLESDIYDQERQIWLSTGARNDLLKGHKYIKQVPVMAALKPVSLSQMTSLIGQSQYVSPTWQSNMLLKCTLSGVDYQTSLKETDPSGLMEGLYIKQENDSQVIARYKYVRHSFLRQILDSGTHLRDREPITNIVSGIVEHAVEL